MYFVYIIFACIPFIFTHIFGQSFFVYVNEFFVHMFGFGAGGLAFERVKVSFFLVTVFSLLLFFLFRFLFSAHFRSFFSRFSSLSLLVFSLFLTLPLVSFGLFGGEAFSFLLGSSEKMHGYIWLLSLVFFWITLLFFSKKIPKIQSIMIITALVLSLLTLFEFFLGQSLWMGNSIQMSWGSFRPIATLGNPNYIAGYLLLCLPIIYTLKQKYLLGALIGLVFFAIISTGSVTAIIFASIFLSIQTLKYFRISPVFFWILFGIGGIGILWLLPSDKMLSLTSRIALQREIISDFHFPDILIGNGIGSVEKYFATSRSDAVNMYFPPIQSIDSSHNIILDFLYEFGILWCIILLWFFVFHWKYFSDMHRSIILLFFGFFSFNIITTAPVLILLLASSYDIQKSSRNYLCQSPSQRPKNRAERSDVGRNT